MNLDWLDAFLIFGTFKVIQIIGLGLLVHLQLGLTRVANFGVVGFWGLGLYAFGVAYSKIDWPVGEPLRFLACALIATVCAGIAGLIVAWLIADLDIDGVLVGTLGFATIVVILATTQQDLTGGALGLGGLDFPYEFGSVKAREFTWLAFTAVVVALIFAAARRYHRTPYGRLLIAVGSNEALARGLGKATSAARMRIFAVTSAAMGLLGAMHAVMVRSLDINSLDVSVTLAALAALILGGTTKVWAAVIGAVLTIGLFDIVVQFYLPVPDTWNTRALPVAREMIFGAAIVLVLIFRPNGLLGAMRRTDLMKRLHDDW